MAAFAFGAVPRSQLDKLGERLRRRRAPRE
jgi:hypothetical protein